MHVEYFYWWLLKIKRKKTYSFDVPDAPEACKVITARKQGDET